MPITETEVIRAAVKKRNFKDAYESLQKKQSVARDWSSSQNKQLRAQQLKIAVKLWQNMCKHIKSLVDQDYVVDTQFFGTFTKLQGQYTYCPGPKAVFKLIENDANIAQIPQLILDDKLISINV